MRPTILCLLAVLGSSCADIAKTADATTTIPLGAGTLSPIEIDRAVTLPVNSLPVCLSVMLTLPEDNTTVSLTRTDNSCSFSVSQPNLTLLDEQGIQNARKSAGRFDVNAVRRGSVSVEEVDLQTDQGAPLDLGRYVDAVSVQIDKQTLFDRVTPAMLMQSNGDPLTRPLPDSLVNKLKSAVKNGQVATAEMALILILHGDTLSDLPNGLKLRVVLQPELEVNVVDAAF